MGSATVTIQMLGTFSIALGDQQIDDGENRSRKVWLLLAYMIYYRNRAVSQDELVRLLWGDEEGSSNPFNALKTMFHRVRTMLNQLDPSAGHRLIVRTPGSYAWNPDLPLSLDIERFDELCRSAAAAADQESQISYYLQAAKLYQGDFLFRLASEPWVVPIAAYYHNLYLQTIQALLPLLDARARKQDIVDLCRQALDIEPYSEELYYHLIRNLLDLGDQEGAINVYEGMSKLLFDNFGVMPSEELRALHREAMRIVNEHAVTPSIIQEQLQEPSSEPGALVCDYDFFKVLYRAESRSVARNGDAVHIALLSVYPRNDKPLSKRSMKLAMENLLDVTRTSLRRGDIVAPCSTSQYIVMLPQANYENSCMVCDRISKAFSRQYPHSPAALRYSVQPLEPSV